MCSSRDDGEKREGYGIQLASDTAAVWTRSNLSIIGTTMAHAATVRALRAPLTALSPLDSRPPGGLGVKRE